MPNAITALFGADSRPMIREMARGEAVAVGFSKRIQAKFEADQVASLARIKSQMSAFDGFKTAIAARAGTSMMGEKESAAKDEAIRIAEVEAVTRSNQARRLWRQRKSDATAQAEEIARLETAAQIEAATRSNRARRLLRERAAIREAGGGVHGTPGLSSVIREGLVLVREISAGRWTKVPGSFSILVQGLRSMRKELGIFGALFTLTGLAIVGSVAGIVASFFIWHHRVDALAKALETLKVPDLEPPDLSRLTNIEKGWNRIRDAIAEAVDQIHSANSAFETMAGLLAQAQSTEKSLLEIEKRKALDKAGTDPAARARVRAEYAQKEHDLEAKQQNERMKASEDHIKALQKEQDEKTAAAKAIHVESEDDERTHQKILDDAAKAGTEKDATTGKSQLDEDQETVAQLKQTAKMHQYDAFGADHGEIGLSGSQAATLQAAQGRLEDHNKAVAAKAAYDLNKKDRDEARAEQQRLFAEAAAAGADKIKSEKDYNNALLLNKRILADDDKLRAAENDEDYTKDIYGRGEHQATLNSQQRVGSYAAVPDMQSLRLLTLIAQNTGHLIPQPRAPGATPPQHGTAPNRR